MSGIIEEYTNDSIKLKGDNSIIIISNPKRDLIFIKIMEPINLSFIDEQIKEEISKPSDPNLTGNDLRISNLAKLRKLKLQQEKEILSEKMKEHCVSGTRTVQYGLPGNIKIKDTE